VADSHATVLRELAPSAERGRTTIADRVVTKVAAIAATEVESVVDTRSGWTTIVRRGLPHAEAVVAGGTTRIAVEVAATWPAPLAQVSSDVRDHVTTRVADLTGTRVSRVDVTVADVVHQAAPARRVL